jgi:hypothetical protein
MLPPFGSETERRRIEDRAGRRFARGSGGGVPSGGLFAPVLGFRVLPSLLLVLSRTVGVVEVSP